MQVADINVEDLNASLEEGQENAIPEIVEETREEVVEEQKVKLGEQEYSQEELSELVGLGSRARELGNAHGGFDKFVSEFGRKSETIGKLKRELEESNKPKELLDSEAEIEQAREAARKLGIVLKDDLEDYYANRRSGEKLLETCSTLESSIDGTDGRPKFETTKVLEFMAVNQGFTDPKRAYEAMNLDQIANWKVENLRGNKGGITTMTSAPAQKMPEDRKPDRNSLTDFIREALQ